MNEALLGPRGSEAQKTQEGQGGERQLHCGDEKRRPRGGAKVGPSQAVTPHSLSTEMAQAAGALMAEPTPWHLGVLDT